jgi:hypothetical protein
MTDMKGDYLRVDYNTGTRSARLTIEDSRERCIHSLIEKGKIVKEWSSRGTIPGNSLSAVFKTKAALYSSVSVPQAFNLISGNYGIHRLKTRSSVRKKSSKWSIVIAVIVIAVLCTVAIFLSVN